MKFLFQREPLSLLRLQLLIVIKDSGEMTLMSGSLKDGCLPFRQRWQKLIFLELIPICGYTNPITDKGDFNSVRRMTFNGGIRSCM